LRQGSGVVSTPIARLRSQFAISSEASFRARYDHDANDFISKIFQTRIRCSFSIPVRAMAHRNTARQFFLRTGADLAPFQPNSGCDLRATLSKKMPAAPNGRTPKPIAHLGSMVLIEQSANQCG
jgi:hypothetical protein